MSSPRRTIGLALVGLLGLGSACTSTSGQSAARAAEPTTTVAKPTSTTTSTTVDDRPRFPLSGLPAEDRTTLGRPALVVKIDNAPKARPQAGLEQADVVFEEVVEGGVTRFLAVFHSQGASSLGPVRSVRPIDPAIVAPLGGLFAYSGGAPKYQRMIRAAPVHLVGYDEVPPAYHREKGRPAPNNLFTSTERLWAEAAGEPPPPPLFTFRKDGEAFGGSTAVASLGAGVGLGERTSAEWTWDAPAGVFRRTTNDLAHVTAAGGQLGFENVVLQFTQYRDTGDVDVGGNRVPEADIVGEGDAWVLSAGRLVKGRWRKPASSAVTEFVDATGAPLAFTPGRTWVSFVPNGAPVAPR